MSKQRIISEVTGNSNPLSVVLLTYNSEQSIQRTLDAIKLISNDIHAVDSFSEDNTLNILVHNGVKVVQRPFENYAAQRNWAIETLDLAHEWQMHVDADEELEPSLIRAIQDLDLEKTPCDGFIVGRKIVFMGKVLRFGGVSKTWHYRIFRAGKGKCENRLYDQHFVGSGKTETINAFMLDHQEDSLSEWTLRHNRWSDMEATEVIQHKGTVSGQISPNFRGNRLEKARANKNLYYKSPLFLRSLLYFLYRYIIQLGVLDGKEGLVYNVLQGFWFRFLVDCKIYELDNCTKIDLKHSIGGK